jgi:hypothetical protein
MSTSLATQLVLDALNMALTTRACYCDICWNDRTIRLLLNAMPRANAEHCCRVE